MHNHKFECWIQDLFDEIRQKIFVPFIGFMVLKTTGLSPRFLPKYRFWKILTESKDISQKVSKFRLPNSTSTFLLISAYFSDPGAYFYTNLCIAGHFKVNHPKIFCEGTSNFGMTIIDLSIFNLKPRPNDYFTFMSNYAKLWPPTDPQIV